MFPFAPLVHVADSEGGEGHLGDGDGVGVDGDHEGAAEADSIENCSLKNGVKNGLGFNFDSVTCVNYFSLVFF